jgi:hypothetical protein
MTRNVSEVFYLAAMLYLAVALFVSRSGENMFLAIVMSCINFVIWIGIKLIELKYSDDSLN